ncbi:uncharacterized protein B0I36DRAFT_359572 [Microdochium trichocladiopsis]|uniref:Peptidyl-prolyl cis-trans isomerase n=1 Tax=Microdochium trichocladiopsis TaxID=1682393 RepID=A0A9P9BYD4_9PEZI|nr:uncharacterized protein B0I36DRAFT_359572 [Microdochium trichocladiopsis]KAH7037948.1 hypothetical protein B0I36DRAFT_359572 [Microdochium trichocladiopsis]
MGAKKQTAKAPAPAKGGKDTGKGDKAAKGAKGKGQDDADAGKTVKTKGGQWITARHILCEKKGKFEQAKDKIQQQLEEGKKGKQVFADVAREFSEDKARQGGLIGKMTKGALMPAFEEVAYALQLSSDKEIHMGEAKTSEGYHLIIVEDRG